MRKESLSKKFTMNGFECEYAIVDSEYLLSLKKHPRNRPSGDIDEDECNYTESDIKKARNHIIELYKQFKENGFEPSVKQFRVGILHGVSYKLDGQHTIGALRIIDDESVKKTGKPEYDEFLVFIKDFKDDTNAFLRELNLINNHNQGFKCSSFGYTSTDEDVAYNMAETAKKLNISTDNAMRIMFGNLSNNLYQNKTMEEAKKNWGTCVDTLYSIFSIFEKKEADNVAKLLRNRDAFIVLNELVSNICHKRYLSYRKDGLDEGSAQKIVRDNCQLLAKHFDMIPPTTVLSALNSASNDGKGRKKSHKQYFKDMLIGRSSKFPKSVINAAKELNGTELKSIIIDWAQEGQNNP